MARTAEWAGLASMCFAAWAGRDASWSALRRGRDLRKCALRSGRGRVGSFGAWAEPGLPRVGALCACVYAAGMGREGRVLGLGRQGGVRARAWDEGLVVDAVPQPSKGEVSSPLLGANICGKVLCGVGEDGRKNPA